MPKIKSNRLINIVLLITIAGLFAGTLLAGMDTPAYAGAPKQLGFGTLMSVEQDGSIIIDKGGYNVDRTAVILDGDGNRVSLKALTLPVDVKFEYIPSSKGPIIKFLRVRGK